MLVFASETDILENLSNDEIIDKFAEISRICSSLGWKDNKVLFFFCVDCYYYIFYWNLYKVVGSISLINVVMFH